MPSPIVFEIIGWNRRRRKRGLFFITICVDVHILLCIDVVGILDEWVHSLLIFLTTCITTLAWVIGLARAELTYKIDFLLGTYGAQVRD